MESVARSQAMAGIVGTPEPTLLPVKPDRVSLISIDVLRAMAALAVLIYHAAAFFDPIVGPVARPSPGVVRRVLDHGWLGVSLFFVISGFCIHLPYALRPSLDAREYLARRFARIWPPFAVAVLFGCAVRVLGGDASLALVKHTVAGLLFLFIGGNPIFFDNVVFWSIVVEVQLYLIYLAIRLVSPRGRQFPLVGWTVAFFLFGIAYHVVAPNEHVHSTAIARIVNPRFFAPARMGEWLVGALAADWIVRHATARPITRGIGISCAVGGVSIVIATRLLTIIGNRDQYLLEPIDAIGFALLVWAVASLEHRRATTDIASKDQHPILNTGPAPRMPGTWASIPAQIFALVGNRSYSIYLFHFLVLQLVARLGIRRFFPAGTTRESLMYSLSGLTLISAAIVVVFVIAEINYRTVELPSHKLARRLGKALAR